MKTRLFSILLVLPAFLCCQENLQQINGCGTGDVTIGLYAHQVADSLADNDNILPKRFLMQTIPYYVNRDLIFRGFNDRPIDSSTIVSSNSEFKVRLTAGLKEFSYLIKYDSSLLYYYQYKRNKIEKIIRYPLDSFTFEPFYRRATSFIRIVHLDETKKTLINNIPCFKGEGLVVETGKPVIFYYHKEKDKIRSPLNTYFNSDFTYNVIRVKFITEWTDQGTLLIDGGNFICQVEKYTENIADPKLFKLPAGIPIVDNIPFSQVTQEESQHETK